MIVVMAVRNRFFEDFEMKRAQKVIWGHSSSAYSRRGSNKSVCYAYKGTAGSHI